MHCWLPQEWLQAPQWALLVCRSTHEPPHQVSPAPQQVLFEQLPLAHWMLLVQEPPGGSLAVHAPLAQKLLLAPQLMDWTEVQAPASLHTDAAVALVRSVEHLAAVQVFSGPGYAHCVSDEPSQAPAQFATVLAQGVWFVRGAPVMRVHVPTLPVSLQA